jgi:hypothetical protein
MQLNLFRDSTNFCINRYKKLFRRVSLQCALRNRWWRTRAKKDKQLIKWKVKVLCNKETEHRTTRDSWSHFHLVPLGNQLLEMSRVTVAGDICWRLVRMKRWFVCWFSELMRLLPTKFWTSSKLRLSLIRADGKCTPTSVVSWKGTHRKVKLKRELTLRLITDYYCLYFLQEWFKNWTVFPKMSWFLWETLPR